MDDVRDGERGWLRRWRVQQLLMATAFGLMAAALAWGTATWFTAEERLRDVLVGAARSHAPVPDVVVVDISEGSIQDIGAWPWSRATLADMVEELLGPLGARAVAIDMVLPERADAVGDDRLASMAEHAPLVLSQMLDFAPRSQPVGIGPAWRGEAVGLPAMGSASAGQPPAPARATGHVANHPGLQKARCLGHIGIKPDADGVLRRLPVWAQLGDQTYASLGLALVACADPQRAAHAAQRLQTDHGFWRVPFRHSIDAFEALPAEAVIRGTVAREAVQGRLVLIGSSAVGLSDYVATPLQPVTAGVLVHAQLVAELTGAAPRPAWLAAWPAGAWALASTALCLALVALGFARRLRLGWTAVALGLTAWLATASWALAQGLAPMVLPALAATLAFGLSWTGFELALARRVSRRAMATLGHYVAQPVLRQLVRQGLGTTLQPTRRHITVLVADMVGYTRITAQSSLEDSAQLTREFLEVITSPVLESQGTLDRYTGDGLIAFWGAPLPVDDHAQRALRAAEDMLVQLQAFNRRRAEAGQPPVAMRVGIESGEAVVGDLGSSKRGVYTAVGTCINLASRLQEMARDLGEPLVVGPQAFAAGGAALRSLGRHAVRGLDEPVELHGQVKAADKAAAPIQVERA